MMETPKEIDFLRGLIVMMFYSKRIVFKFESMTLGKYKFKVAFGGGVQVPDCLVVITLNDSHSYEKPSFFIGSFFCPALSSHFFGKTLCADRIKLNGQHIICQLSFQLHLFHAEHVSRMVFITESIFSCSVSVADTKKKLG